MAPDQVWARPLPRSELLQNMIITCFLGSIQNACEWRSKEFPLFSTSAVSMQITIAQKKEEKEVKREESGTIIYMYFATFRNSTVFDNAGILLWKRKPKQNKKRTHWNRCLQTLCPERPTTGQPLCRSRKPTKGNFRNFNCDLIFA